MILVNGVATDSVAATDRGLAYGDGVFRTLLAEEGSPRSWPRQYHKLARDCEALAIPCPPEGLLAREVGLAIDRASDAVVKIIVTRGSGARGYAPPHPVSPTRIILAAPRPDYPEEFGRAGVKVGWCRTRASFQPRLAGVKHLNRLDNVLARAEWTDPAVPEGLMVDEEGHIIGGTMTNLFILEGGGLATPLLSRCGVAGVTREIVIEAARKRGMDCREEPITRARLIDAQAVLLVNSVIGVWQVSECAGHRWKPADFAESVREWLDDDED